MAKTIWCHHDADGITSAYLTSFAFPEANIKVTNTFGETTDWQDGDIMVDMRPQDPSIKGLVIDHHPGHQPIGIRGYELVWDNKPASIVCFEHFKDKIPKSQWWKTVIGAAGDGQVEKVPYEIWASCKALLKNYSTYVNKSSTTNWQWRANLYPIYNSLSSGINAFCRYGRFDMAFEVMKKVNTPLELITDSDIIDQKARLKKDFEGTYSYPGIMRKAKVLELPNFKIVLYSSEEVRVTGYVASVLSDDNYTIIAINEVDGSLSVRGTLANYLKGVIEENKLDYINVDGHDGFMGGKISVDPIKLYYDLMEIL